MNIDRLLEWPFKDVIQSYTARDSMFYALSIGIGADPVDPKQLRYVFEKDLVAVPSMALVLGHPGTWANNSDSGIDVRKVVYAAQELVLHAPLPPQATIRARESVVAVIDKGAEKGSLMSTERHIVDHESGTPLATLRATLMLRGNGGFGRSHGEIKPYHPVPTTAPERIVKLSTWPQQALLYRLNADMNPLHADPELAKQVGFERPILHGLCTYGFAVHGILKLWSDYDATQIESLAARFSAPVYPGETLRIETWREGNVVTFCAWSDERGVKVLDNGRAVLKG